MKLTYKLAPALLALALVTPTFASDYTNHWAKTSIDKWTGHNIVAGYEDGTFRPNSHVTRAELATFITRTFGLTDTTHSRKYIDVDANKWYVDAANKVSAKGIMYTPGDKFLPNQKVTREEAAYAMHKAYQMAYTETGSVTNYKDESDISTWAVDAVSSLVAYGYITGYEDNTFRPQGNITRAEIVKMLDNLSPNYISKAGTHNTSLEGNTVINTGDVTLKDLTIDGNLYITQGVESGKVTLDNVKVTGTLYIDGGEVKLGGAFETIEVASGRSVQLQKGTAKKIIVEKSGTVLTLEKGTVTDYLMILEEVQIKGEGIIKQTSDTKGQKLGLSGAGIYIDGELLPVEAKDNKITIDLQELSAKYGTYNLISGLQINSTIEGAYINSYEGQMQTNTRYDFRRASQVTGLLDEILENILEQSSSLKEMANIMGITGESAFDILGIGSSVSIHTMLDNYKLVKDMVYGYAGVTIPNEYTFVRQLCYEGEESVDIEIKLILGK